MMQQTSRDEEGTLAYVKATGNLFLKVPQGWKEIQVLAKSNGKKVYGGYVLNIAVNQIAFILKGFL